MNKWWGSLHPLAQSVIVVWFYGICLIVVLSL